jgi:uncharacterized protein YjiS (DUF1127 family)
MTTIGTVSTDLNGSHRHASLHELLTAGLAGVSEMLVTLMDWHYRARERRQLLSLSDQALLDFGASRAEADNEGGKPFWRS